MKNDHPTPLSLVAKICAFIVSVTVVMPLIGQTPVAQWKFDEGTGVKAFDSSGNNHTALLSDGITWTKGPHGEAISASGAQRDSVAIPPVDLSATHAVTIALWVKRDYSSDGGAVLLEASGDYLTIQFENVVINPNLNDKTFHLNLPPGVQRVKAAVPH